MNKIILFILILTTLFYFTFTFNLDTFKVCSNGLSVNTVSVYQMDLDDKLTYDYFDNNVIRLLNDYFDRTRQLAITKYEQLDYKNNLENTYNYYRNDSIDSNNVAVPLRTNITYINKEKLDQFIENDMKIFNHLLREDPDSPVLKHFLERILPLNLESPINMLVVPYIKDNLKQFTINGKLVVLLGFFREDGERNIEYFSNNLPKNWIRNYEKNIAMIDTLIEYETKSKSNSTESLNVLESQYYLLKEELDKFKDTIKKQNAIERRLIKDFNILSKDELSELTLTNNNLKLELNEYNIVKQEFDEIYKKIIEKYEKPRENKAIVNKKLLIAKAEVNKYKSEYEKLTFIKELGYLLLNVGNQEGFTNLPDKCSVKNNTINHDLCEESKMYENLDFNKVDEDEKKILFGNLGLNNYLVDPTQPVSKCDSKYLSSFDNSYL